MLHPYPSLPGIAHILQELFDKVSLCTMDFDTIEACCDGVPGTSDKASNVRFYLQLNSSVSACGTTVGLVESGIGEAETSGELLSLARTSGRAALSSAHSWQNIKLPFSCTASVTLLPVPGYRFLR
jgi:hypothetical protein